MIDITIRGGSLLVDSPITAMVFDSEGNALMIRGNAKGIDYTETGVQYTLMDYFTWLEANGSESEKSVGKVAKDY